MYFTWQKQESIKQVTKIGHAGAMHIGQKELRAPGYWCTDFAVNQMYVPSEYRQVLKNKYIASTVLHHRIIGENCYTFRYNLQQILFSKVQSPKYVNFS